MRQWQEEAKTRGVMSKSCCGQMELTCTAQLRETTYSIFQNCLLKGREAEGLTRNRGLWLAEDCSWHVNFLVTGNFP